MTTNPKPIKRRSDIALENFKEEAELFFVTEFITTKTLSERYRQCLDLFFGLDNDSEADYGRGLILYSKHYGQGKSFFFDVIDHRCKRIENRNIFKRINAKELVSYCIENGYEELIKLISCKSLFIDDIGDEGEEKEFQVKHSKNKINVLREVLLFRYSMWIEKGWKTYGTTNLNFEQMASVYDGRVSDRLKEMVNWIDFTSFKSGESFRQYAKSRKLTQDEIKANWAKIQKPIIQESYDYTEYMNSLLIDSDEFVLNIGETSLNIIKGYMLEKGYMNPEELSSIDEPAIEAGKMKARKQAREYVKVLHGNCIPVAQSNILEEMLSKINNKEGRSVAENTIVLKKLMEYKKTEGFKFV